MNISKNKNFLILQEILLDYGFTHLGLNESKRKPKSNENLVGCVPHPIVMSESFGNPNSCRAGTIQLIVKSHISS